jgi:peptide/nickel transport system ATP-binding protein
MMSAPLLTIDSLCVSIGGERILESVSLQVAPGEVLGLVGASGSGKSMAALAVMRLLPAGARVGGSVSLQGKPLGAMSERELQAVRGREIGIVFQEPMTALNPLMRIGDQVAETVRLHRSVPPAEARGMARTALDAAGLSGPEGALDRYPYELSGGQRQRVAIAIATVLSPSLLIADEPTTALDAGSQADVLRLLAALSRDRGMGLILISHDFGVISQTTQRVAVMQGGRIVEQGSTRELLTTPHHPYTQALLAAANLDAKRPRRRESGSPAVLEVREIVREYPRRRVALWRRPPPLRAVDGVSLAIHAGETVGLVGESGSGKSTLLRTILALDRPQSGEVRLLGEDFSAAVNARQRQRQRRLRRSIQVVPQDPYGSFDPLWRVEQLIAEPFYALQTPPEAAQRRAAIAAVLEQVGLSAADAQRYPHEFSGGQRQRIAIARALILKPAVIAFDEAVSALDVLVRAQILELLAALAERLELAYLFVSHDLSVVRSIADRVYVMRQGRIVEEGPTERVFSAPQHEYTKALLAAVPRIGATG